MRLKIWCDGESEKFYKIFRELNKALQNILQNMNSTNFVLIWQI